jgi:hypothetical protein
MLDKKLQLKETQRIAIVGNAPALDIKAERSAISEADAILIFVTHKADISVAFSQLQTAAKHDKLAWLAYPKAKQLSTDLNRDIIRELANSQGLDPVRQISIDEVWSALRLKSL